MNIIKFLFHFLQSLLCLRVSVVRFKGALRQKLDEWTRGSQYSFLRTGASFEARTMRDPAKGFVGCKRATEFKGN